MIKLTVFTPTYNRAHLLPRLYESLCRQTCKDFEWLIIDDGSGDDTKSVVDGFIRGGRLNITYLHKHNGGMHTAHNTAFAHCTTKLILCVDSDDILTDNAVELIENKWNSLSETAREEYAGMVAYNLTAGTDRIIGTSFPEQLEAVVFHDIYYKYRIAGDKALVYRTDLIKQNEYPSFGGEKFVPLDMKYLSINKPLLVLKDALRIVEYQRTGYSHNIDWVYIRNPKGLIYYHLFRMQRVQGGKTKIKSIIHYVGLSLFVGKKKLLSDIPYKLLTIVLFPLGWLRFKMLQHYKKRGGEYNEL